MSDHILELLGAYIDGELQGKTLQHVESHVIECLICQEEYTSLKALSTFLQDDPPPEFPPVDQFTANVALQLPRKPTVSLRHNTLNIGWWFIPIGLIGVWIFLNATNLVSNVVTAAYELGIFNSASPWFVSSSPGEGRILALIEEFGILEQASLYWLQLSRRFTRIILSNIFWQASIAIFYLSWIAIWWAGHTRQGLGQSLES